MRRLFGVRYWPDTEQQALAGLGSRAAIEHGAPTAAIPEGRGVDADTLDFVAQLLPLP